MNSIPKLFVQFSVFLVLICFTEYGLSTEKEGGLVLISNNRHRHRNQDIILFGGQKGCGPSLIKTGGHRHRQNDMILLGGCKKKEKKEEKKIEYIPYPVKEYVPVMVEKKKEMEMDMPMMHMPMDEHGMGMASMQVEIIAQPVEDRKPIRLFRRVRKMLRK